MKAIGDFLEMGAGFRGDSRRMTIRATVLLAACAVAGLGCSDDGAEPEESGGSSGAGNSAGAGGSSSSGGGSGGTSGAASVDCAALCERVRTLCPGEPEISELWLDACRSSCDARVQVAPEIAEREQRCVDEATACDVAVLCVAAP